MTLLQKIFSVAGGFEKGTHLLPFVRVLCSERVSQMSKTYNDIEAVTRLLEEKEKDLELTARIGKELLTHNNKLETNVANLEAELKAANDKIEQITHELAKKTELIQVLTNDTDESGSEAGTPTALKCINIEFMQRRIKALEDENKALQKEFRQLTKDAEKEEEKEKNLVEIISMKLATANVELEGMSDDLERQKEENRHEHEQIVSLKAKLKDTEEKYHKVLLENEDLINSLNITKDTQNKLAAELIEFKDRYEEVINLLQDAQEHLKNQRKKTAVRGGCFSSLSMTGSQIHNNLASELESSLHSELSLDSGIGTDRIPSYKKVFETVKYGQPKNLGSSRSSPVATAFNKTSTLEPSLLTSSNSAPRMSAFASYPSKNVDPNRRNIGSSTVYSSFSVQSLDSAGVSDSESVASDEITYPNGPVTGVPGVPGSTEIADALRRLTPAELSARRAAFGSDTPGMCRGYSEYDATIVPLGCRTPDSIMSTGSSGYGGHNYLRIPNKLQIVKRMEGSQTLHQWSMLAKPTLGGLLEERPGVQTKGGKTLEDLGFEMYTLSDVEEDDEFINPGKSFQNSSSIYTYTNSTVMHPDDNTSVTHSLVGSKVCTGATNSRQSTAPPTPRGLSRRNSCSTFSMTYGLAQLLNERGIEAATLSTLNTPSCEKSFSPTATPVNSPYGSPVMSRSPSPTPFNPLKLPGFISSGAELLRRKFISDSPPRSPQRSRRNKLALSRAERKALSSIRLVQEIEKHGLDMQVGSSSSIQLPLQGTLYHRSQSSPMAQLTNLKGTLTSPSIDRNLSDLGRPSSVSSSGRGTPTQRQRRADLGTVSGKATAATSGEQSSGPLGTISTMLFGRKGGLL
ncbi:hypothetical protein RUM43_006371 [Polyplax serrata]|uniref:Trafficking kinesin-binding protein milt n=1 Tax=Polyplax serrata TaxID=468196 RepID=A0AAN8S5E5_POLSC